MRYLSVCSGIEAATCAWHPLGWRPFAFSEIDKFPSAVLAHHYPNVPNLGDMTQFKEWPDATIDLLVGGTPCQSFSVAGLRKGLADPRGNLMLTYLAIADRYRPRWLVWENVPGVLSSGGGRDFGAFLGALGKLGYGWAYRSLDAQYFNLAQRRERVFVVGCLGSWQRAAAVLFERASLSGHPAPRREAGKDVAPCLDVRAGRSGETTFHTSGGLVPQTARCISTGEGTRQDYETTTLVAHSFRADGFDASEDGTGRGTPLVPVQPMTLAIRGRGDSHDLEYRQDGTANAILTPNGGRGGIGVGAVAFDTTQVTSKANRSNPKPGDPCHPLAAGAHAPAVAFDARQSDVVQYGEKTGPLDTCGFTMGILQGVSSHADATQAGPAEALRALRREIGAEAFAKWGLGILASLQTAEVLQPGVHGAGIRPASFSRSWVVCCALGSPFTCADGAVQSVREAIGEGRASQGWQPSEQFARELGAYLSELSQPGAQAERFMRDLWQADEGVRLLRQALSAIQNSRRSAGGESQSAPGGMQVRRLTVMECEFLQGFPRGYTAIPYRNKPAADGPRYKALGNSMAVPCMRWIGQRIAAVDAIEAA